MQKREINAFFIIIVLLVSKTVFSDELPDSRQQHSSYYGISLAAAAVPFIGGASGPTVLVSDGQSSFLSETNYNDTFDPGYGGRVEIFYDWNRGWRIYLGGVYNQWEGKYFQGGRFPQGGQFDDFSMAGIYIGVKHRFFRDSNVRPYLFGNLGIVKLSDVNVTAEGNKIPYWNQTYRDYLDLGGGIEYGLTKKIAIYLDMRLEIFGKPESVDDIFSGATAGTTLPVTFGIDYRL